MAIVSVIIPTYNRAFTLPRAIKSVLSQDFCDLELIVVDDGSGDETERVVSAIHDSRLRFIKHEVNLGVGAARNTGIDAASGDFVAFQDSDDEWLDGKLAKQIRSLQAGGEDCVMAYCTKIVYGLDQNLVRGQRRSVCVPGPDVGQVSGDLRETLWRANMISTQTMLIRTKALRRVGGFDTRLRSSEEWDLAIRLAEIGTFAFVDEPLVNTYAQNDSISIFTRGALYSQLIISNKLKRRGVPAYVQADRWARLGYNLGKMGNPRLGNKLLKASLSAQPLVAKTWGRFFANWLLRRRRYKK